MLNEYEQNNILKDFPNVELSYETIIHKTLHDANFVLAIPEGNKCFAWFTIYKAQNVCILLEISENKQICNVKLVSACFHSQLSYGSIFYGTFFKHDNTNFFCTEDIYYYKGKNVSHHSFLSKLDLFKHIFESEIKQISFTHNNVVFGLPIISTTLAEMTNMIELLPYSIKYIQFKYANKKTNNMVMKYEKSNDYDNTINTLTTTNRNNNKQTTFIHKNDMKREIVFKVKPEIQNDIYNLYMNDNGSDDTFYDIAYITDYKTSVMMNKLFRNIKENQNLDALEESDDEDEFENDRIDKFVYLDKSYNMVCVYNYKFRKWMPIRIAGKNERIITKNDLFRLEKNK